MRLGLPHLHERTIGSTNARARAAAIAGAPHGTMVSADIQTAGRGRQGRAWLSPVGVLAQSLVLRPPYVTARTLPLAVAVAVATSCGPQAVIKWPNDIWSCRPQRGRRPSKIAGILVEMRVAVQPWFVVGIGINAAVDLAALDADVRAGAGTLGLSPEGLPQLRARLLMALEQTLAWDDRRLLDAWRARDALSGTEIAWDGGRKRGIADGIESDGALRVKAADGTVATLIAGEVHLDPVASI